MSVIQPSAGLRQFQVGYQVTRSGAVLPATATGTIFDVNNGSILLFGLVGKCTTVCSATATNVKASSDPDVGAAADICANTAVESSAVGTLLSLPAAAGSAFTKATGYGLLLAAPMVVPAGVITLTTSATNTGAFQWDAFWLPLDEGATLTAA